MYTHVDQQLAAPSVCTRPLRQQHALLLGWLFASMGPGFGLEESSGPTIGPCAKPRAATIWPCRRSRRFDLHLDLVFLHLDHTGSCGSHVSASVCLLAHTCMLVVVLYSASAWFRTCRSWRARSLRRACRCVVLTTSRSCCCSCKRARIMLSSKRCTAVLFGCIPQPTDWRTVRLYVGIIVQSSPMLPASVRS